MKTNCSASLEQTQPLGLTGYYLINLYFTLIPRVFSDHTLRVVCGTLELDYANVAMKESYGGYWYLFIASLYRVILF